MTPKELIEQPTAARKVSGMNKISRPSGVAAALLLGLALAGCTSEAPKPKAPEVEAVDPDPPGTETENKSPVSERGNLIKTVGEPAGISQPGSTENAVDFVVVSIETDPGCTGEFAAEHPVENGSLVRVQMEVSTNAAYDGVFMPHSVNWKWIDANGVTMNGSPDSTAAYACINDAERLPIQIGPGEKAAGAIMFDVTGTEGTLVFSQGPDTGWEWEVPAV